MVFLFLEAARLVGRVAEDEGKVLVVLFADVLHAAAHGGKTRKAVQPHRAGAHFREGGLHLEQGDALDMRVEGVKVQPHDAAARAEVGDYILLFPPRKAREEHGVAGEAVQAFILNDAQVPFQQFFDALSLIKGHILPEERRLFCFHTNIVPQMRQKHKRFARGG